MCHRKFPRKTREVNKKKNLNDKNFYFIDLVLSKKRNDIKINVKIKKRLKTYK